VQRKRRHEFDAVSSQELGDVRPLARGAGHITLWLSPDAIESWKPAPSGKRGGQRQYSDLAIETALTLRLVFNLPSRTMGRLVPAQLGVRSRGRRGQPRLSNRVRREHSAHA